MAAVAVAQVAAVAQGVGKTAAVAVLGAVLGVAVADYLSHS